MEALKILLIVFVAINLLIPVIGFCVFAAIYFFTDDDLSCYTSEDIKVFLTPFWPFIKIIKKIAKTFNNATSGKTWKNFFEELKNTQGK